MERENRSKFKQQQQVAPQAAYGAGLGAGPGQGLGPSNNNNNNNNPPYPPYHNPRREAEPTKPASQRQPSPTPFLNAQQPPSSYQAPPHIAPAKRASDAVFAPASAAAAAARDRFSQNQVGAGAAAIVGPRNGQGLGLGGGDVGKRNPSVSEERRLVEESTTFTVTHLNLPP